MPGSKAKYTQAQKRQAEHIAKGYREKGVSARVAKQRAWATVNKMSGGGKKSGSGRGKSTSELNKRKKSVAKSSVASRKGTPLKRTAGSRSITRKRSTTTTAGKRGVVRKRSTTSAGARKRSTISRISSRKVGRTASSRVRKPVRSASSRSKSINGFAHKRK
jgi:plasmid stabilization system protein ParE